MRYRAPLEAPTSVVRPFDPPEQPWLPGHRGVDLAAGPGAVVVAPAEGTVTFAGEVAGRGVVTVTHPDGRRSSVEPVRPGVVAGEVVAGGTPVATVDGTAHADASAADVPLLHWGVRLRDGTYVDPWSLLPGEGPVVLLP